MSEHARLSFSASERWLRCPASVRMSEGRTGGDSDAAKEGTFAHSVLERTLKYFLATDELEIDLQPHHVPKALEYLNMDLAEMRQAIWSCAEYIVDTFDEMGGRDECTMLLETPVNLHYISNRDDLWGTADVILYNAATLEVIDLKYGAGIFVEADTSQNRLYVLGQMCKHMKETKGEIPWEFVYGTILQPRYLDSDGQFQRFTEYDPNDLLKWFEDDVLPIAKLTDLPSELAPEPVAGQKQCQFCLAKPDCPAAAKMVAGTMIAIPFEDQGSPDTPVQVIPDTIPNVDDLELDRLIDIHDKIPFVSGYLKAVTKRLHELLEARDPRLTGRLKLVYSSGRNEWNCDDAEVVEQLTKGRGKIPKKELVQEKLLSAPQALKLKLKPAQKKRLEELVSKSQGSLSIVPDSDPRPNALPALPFESAEKVASEQPSGFDFI